MAESSILVDQDQFICAVCLDLLKDPVTIPCGHSFCKVCINDCWDHEDQKGIYSCPQCKNAFNTRPVLCRNIMLAEVVEKVKKTEVEAASPAYGDTGEIKCDFCTGEKVKATKSCLQCVASFCELHLKPHLELSALRKHTLTEASAELRKKICSEHNRALEFYCRTDQTCICCMCKTNNHKGHDTVTAEAERAERQDELEKQQMKSQLRIQEKEKEVQELKQAVNNIKLGTQTALEDSDKFFTALISYLEKKRSETRELIRAQEKAEVIRTEQLLEQLEEEIADLRRRVTELEELSHTHDPIHFLQVLASGRRSPEFNRPSFQKSTIIGVRNSLSDVKKRFEEFCEDEFNKIPPHDEAVTIISPPEPQSREDFMKYFRYLTLDTNTVHRNLILSQNNRVLTHTENEQPYPDHPERFDCRYQVLSKESVCGRCYWEVEWSGVGVDISLAYKDVGRKGHGDESAFGQNSRSWNLWFSPKSALYFYHNSIRTDLKVPSSSRIGVYVDHGTGTLSFYSVSDNMKLLHRVRTTFTQPLYAGFGPCCLFDSSVRLCDRI